MSRQLSQGRVLMLVEAALYSDPTDKRLSQLLGAVAVLGPSVLLVTGSPSPTLLASLCSWSGVAEVILVDETASGPEPLRTDWPPEDLAALIVSMAGNFSHIVAASSSLGSTVLPRVAARLAGTMVTGVQQICAADTFIRPLLAGNGLATLRVSGHPICLTLHCAGFAPALQTTQPAAAIRTVTAARATKLGLSRLLERLPVERGLRPELASARIVVAGGGGLAKADGFDLIEALADRLGAAVGASRGAVDAELAPSGWQIGQTGHIIAPQLYIGIGISGAIQHLAGIKDAKTIVAINQDPSAPLMRIADLALEADLFQAIPALLQALGETASTG
ncbi:MAG: electron transfer flavoprotein subunit alpha/FixB family protein [Magnetococcales bacterium]|nr:electron transfer flavoprotein subunit alpha/FixB family protein [Magnetococcales bacterium]